MDGVEESLDELDDGTSISSYEGIETDAVQLTSNIDSSVATISQLVLRKQEAQLDVGQEMDDLESEPGSRTSCDGCFTGCCESQSQCNVEEALWQICDDQNYIVNTLVHEMRAERIQAQNYYEKLMPLEVQSLEQTVFDLKARVLELEKENKYQKAVLTYREIKLGPYVCDHCQDKPDIPGPPNLNVLLRALNIPCVNMTSVGVQCDMNPHYYDGDMSLHSAGKTWFYGVDDTPEPHGESISFRFQTSNDKVSKEQKAKRSKVVKLNSIHDEKKIKNIASDFPHITPSSSELSILRRRLNKLQKEYATAALVPKCHSTKCKDCHSVKLTTTTSVSAADLTKKCDLKVHVEIMPVIFRYESTETNRTLSLAPSHKIPVKVIGDINVQEKSDKFSQNTCCTSGNIEDDTALLCKPTDDKNEPATATFTVCNNRSAADESNNIDIIYCEICIPHVLSGRYEIPRLTRVKQFIQMLEDNFINRHSTLKNKLHKLISDPRYLHLSSSQERQREFDNYVNRERTNWVNNIQKIHRKYMKPGAVVQNGSTDDMAASVFAEHMNTAFGPVQSLTDDDQTSKNNHIMQSLQQFKTEQTVLISILRKLDGSTR